MLKSVFAFLRGSPSQQNSAPGQPYAAPVKAAPRTPHGVPVYPPIDQGVAPASVDAVLATQEDMIRRLRLLSGINGTEFDVLYLNVLKTLAAYIDLLPASSSGTHMGAGGLFRLCLEIAFFSRQAAEGMIFAGREGVETRRDIEPRWRYAAFLAGLCCELHRPLGKMVVVTESGEQWAMHAGGVCDWLKSVQATRYFVRWVDEEQRFGMGLSSILANRIIPATSLQYLQEGNTKIIPAMLDAVMTEQANKDNPLSELVGRMRRKVIDRDLVLSPQNYGRLMVGTHLEPHLVDAMRTLVSKGVWVINQKKARLWYGKDGLFVVWKTAAKEMRDELSTANVSGIPQDATTLAETLLKAGIFVADASGDLYWKIKTPLSESELIAVRLASPNTLLVALETPPEPLDQTLIMQEGGAHSQAAPSPAVTDSPQLLAQTTTAPVVAEQTNSELPPQISPASPAMDSVIPVLNEQPDEPTAQAAQNDSPKPNGPKAKSGPKNAKGGGRNQSQATPRPVGDAELPVVEEVHIPDLPDDVAAQMSKPVRGVVAQLVFAFNQGKLKAVTAKKDEGFAICVEHLADYGIEIEKILVELHRIGWLYCAPENPRRKLHKTELGGKETQVAIIKTQVAMDLGFKI